MHPSPPGSRRAFVVVELLTVVAVIAVLLGLGFSVYRGARLSARAAIAESNLKQVGAALELFFLKYQCYPPQGANLAAVLAPFVRDLSVFENPLKDEATPGQTLNELYREPCLTDLDSPGKYIVALVTEDGSTAVVLRTGESVERIDGLALPTEPSAIVAVLSPPEAGRDGGTTTGGDTGDTSGGSSGDEGGDTTGGSDTPPEGDTGDVGGELNINPNNNDDFEFDLQKPDGSHITRDELHASSGSLSYSGEALRILVKPKGNGNQNTLTLNGQVYHLENKNRYLVLRLPGGSIMVHLYNSKAGRGKAMGKWWMAIDARNASISICKCGAVLPAGCTCGEEAE